MTTHIDWPSLAEPIARIVWGAPSVETRDELRWGARGSKRLIRAKGKWQDFETNSRGGAFDLVPGSDAAERMRWLCDHRLIEDERRNLNGTANGGGALFHIITTYDYRDENNALLFQVCRLTPKDFRQRVPDGKGGWTWKLGSTRRVLYRLPKLIEEISQKRLVFVVEGEKDADNLRALELAATCNPGGANKWRPEYTETLRGADVIIIGDNDKPGREHVASVAASLQSVAARVRVLDLARADRPAKDISDWLAAGGTAEQLNEIIQRLPDWGAGRTAMAKVDWPEPKPLPSGLSPVEAFNSEFMPTNLAPWIDDIANRLQCPPDYVAVAALTALGSVIGRRIGIKPQRKTDWVEVPNVWGLFIGRPGMLKSPAMMEALKPIHHLEAQAAKENQTAQEEYEAGMDAFKLRKEVVIALKKKELKKDVVDLAKFKKLTEEAPAEMDLAKPKEPIPVRFRTNDSTYEGLGELLIANPNGILVERDEMVSLLKHLDRDDQAVARGFYLSGWAGTQPYTFDRIMRGHRHIEAVCLSVLGNTQPARIGEYVRRANAGGGGGDGVIQRFGLAVWPDASPDWRNVDEYPDSAAREMAWQVFDRISKMDESAMLGAGALKSEFDKVPYFRFDDDAHVDFVGWRADLERRVRSGELSAALEGHLAKYRKLVPALTLMNHLADSAGGPVSREALLRALAFAHYLESHARRLYGSGFEVEVAAAKSILRHIRAGDLKNGFTARDVHQGDWANLTDREHVRAGLSLLADQDYIAEAPTTMGRQGGRPKVTFLINPRAVQ